MLQMILFFLAFTYVAIAACLFKQWLIMFQQEHGTRLQQRLSIALLVIAIILWPIVVPFAYLELLSKSKKDKEITKLMLEQLKHDSYQN